MDAGFRNALTRLPKKQDIKESSCIVCGATFPDSSVLVRVFIFFLFIGAH